MEKRKRTGDLFSTSVGKKMKRVLAVAMTVLMIISVIDYSGIVTRNVKAESVYDEYGFGTDGENTTYQPALLLTTEICNTQGISEGYAGYYAIYNAGQLFWFAEQVNSVNSTIKGKLMSDIDLSEKPWAPIGTYSDTTTANNNPYKGTFDGDYHVISNLTVSVEGAYETGLFGRTQGAVIKNLGIEAATVTNNSSIRAGILGGEIYQSTVTNCYTNGTVSTGDEQAGGIAGESAESTLTNCFTTLTVLTNSGTTVNCYAKTTENKAMFITGELAYCLNGSTSEGSLVWGQTLSVSTQDTHPVFFDSDPSNKVYKISYQVGAAEAAARYLNSGMSTKLLTETDFTVEPGYRLKGWYQGEDNTNLLAVGLDVNNITADRVYHADLERLTVGWKNISYVLGNNNLPGLNNGETITGLLPVEYYPGGTYVLPSPERTGFHFLGWYADANCGGEAIQSVSADQTGDLTLYAKFEPEWDGTTYDTTWLSSGTGTSDDPYRIGTPNQLADLALSVNDIAGESYSGKYFKVTDNLNMGKTWTPIGTADNKFCGSFDGDLHTVTFNITNTEPSVSGRALFGYLGAGAEIKNLGTTGTITTAGKYTGGIVAFAQDGAIAITNCWSSVNINYTNSYDSINNPNGKNSAEVGGIVGTTNSNGAVTMTNCYYTGKISGGRFSPVGGLCSSTDNASFNAVNCYSAGTYNNDIPFGYNLVYGGNVTNCFYLNKTYQASTQGTQITSEMLASGELAWLLQGGNTSDTIFWGQTCGSGYPELTTDATKKPLKVSYDVKNQIVKTQYVNTAFNLPETIDTVPGYDFVTWTDANGTPVSGEQKITEDTTYKATFALKEDWHTITYKVGSADHTSLTKGEEITGLSVSAFQEGSETILPNSYTYKGTTLVGWFTDADCTDENKVTKIDANTTMNQIFYGKFISWDGSTMTEPQKDVNGTYLIGTPADLAWFAYMLIDDNMPGSTAQSYDRSRSYNAKLTADINLGSNKMYMIGEKDNVVYNYYCGTFDGNGHTITIDTINGHYSSDKIALFQYLGAGATIKNLGIQGSIEASGTNTGGLISRVNAGGGIVTISNCWSTVDITQQSSDPVYSGGLIGEIASGTVVMENCYFAGSITGLNGGSVQQVGGLCGNNSGTLKAINCYVSGSFATDPLLTTSGENLVVGTGTFTPINCYYMDAIRTDSTQGTQFTSENLINGELAYLLDNNVYGQTLPYVAATSDTPASGDAHPVYLASDGSNKVYRATFEAGEGLETGLPEGVNQYYYGNSSISFPAFILTEEEKAAAGYQYDLQITTGTATHDKVNNQLKDISGDVTVTVTKKLCFTIKAQPTDPSLGTVMGSGTYDAGTSVTLTAKPRAGCKFAKWTSDAEGNTVVGTEKTLPITENISATYYAWFTKDTYMLVVIGYDPAAGIVGGAKPEGYSYNEEATLFAIANPGYSFDGWKNEYGVTVTTGSAISVKVTGNMTITPEFTQMIESATYYTAAFYHQSGFMLKSAKVAENSTITPPTTPTKAGYDFIGWSTDGTNAVDLNPDGSITITSDMTLRPLFQVKAETYSLTINGASTACTPLSSVTAQVAPADIPEGQKFAYWSDAAGNIVSYSNPYSFSITGDIALMAVYEAMTTDVIKEPTLTLSSATYEAVSTDKHKMIWYAAMDLPEGYTLVESGILRVVSTTLQTNDQMTFDTLGIYRRIIQVSASVPNQYYYSVTASYDKGVSVRAYIVVRDNEGNLETIYSDVKYGGLS